MYKSEFCEVDFLENEKVLVLTWKKFCRGEDYREPIRYMLKQLEHNKNKNVIFNVKNGFEDEKEDIEWAFAEFIPSLSKTDCKTIIFVTNQVSDIEAEIDRFTSELLKYFEVKKMFSLEEALKVIARNDKSKRIVLNVVYTVAVGKREEFYDKICKVGIPQESRLEEGNLKYEYYFPVESEDRILLIEVWRDQASLDIHKETAHYKKLQTIKEKYITDVKFEKYSVC